MDVSGAVDRGDLDELSHLIDSCCANRDWEALTDLRDRSRRAHERGRQLWPITTHAEYRLALEAPGSFAAAVLVEGAGRFALGPLPEVAAARHEWPELAPHVAPGPPAVLALHERVVRGEDCSAAPLPGPPVLDLPTRLQRWEPPYPLAEYRSHSADFPTPPLPSTEPATLPTPPEGFSDDATRALTALVDTWTTASDGRVEALVVEGTAIDAIAALRPPVARVAPLDTATALAVLAWAGASGGAHGRRPGGAAGRFGAWWAAAALVDRLDDWPVPADELGAAIDRLEWFVWDAAEPASGWELRVAVTDPRRGRGWAVAAVDAR